MSSRLEDEERPKSTPPVFGPVESPNDSISSPVMSSPEGPQPFAEGPQPLPEASVRPSLPLVPNFRSLALSMGGDEIQSSCPSTPCGDAPQISYPRIETVSPTDRERLSPISRMLISRQQRISSNISSNISQSLFVGRLRRPPMLQVPDSPRPERRSTFS